MKNWYRKGRLVKRVAVKRLSNGQVAKISFRLYYCQRINKYPIFEVDFAVSSSKKRINLYFEKLQGNATGTCGLEGLLFAYEQIKNFQTYLNKVPYLAGIRVDAFDVPRLNAYKRLLHIGFIHDNSDDAKDVSMNGEGFYTWFNSESLMNDIISGEVFFVKPGSETNSTPICCGDYK